MLQININKPQYVDYGQNIHDLNVRKMFIRISNLYKIILANIYVFL